jgi:hypothetical protein
MVLAVVSEVGGDGEIRIETQSGGLGGFDGVEWFSGDLNKGGVQTMSKNLNSSPQRKSKTVTLNFVFHRNMTGPVGSGTKNA